MRLDGRTAIVTGASSGIGRATAVALAAQGAAVVVTGRNAGALERTIEDVAASPGRACAVVGDLVSSDLAERLVARAIDWTGHLDVVVNAAGVIVRADAPGTSLDAWRLQMAVNVDAVFLVSRAAVPAMQQHGGSIVNVSSTCGLVGSAGLAGYCASKGAVVALTRAMAIDHASDGIRVNAVCPGAVDTPMLRSGYGASPMSDEQILAANLADIPEGRVPEANEVADLIVYLASDSSRHITGTAIPIDGGYTAR